MDHKLYTQILKVSVLYTKCPNKVIKQTVGRIIAGDSGRIHRPPQKGIA